MVRSEGFDSNQTVGSIGLFVVIVLNGPITWACRFEKGNFRKCKDACI